ncbi:hypothetical protein YYC_01501 [Plasmodium yoelii 17X]|uniref:Anaphase-promoting complex subunit 10 n=4 Tax=Plasmodium yoelii TaxID=5861 RepID=A0AAF0B644_PLAYO|nr:uncharacterized protein PY17X_1435600 [Plasmodium yoelii]EAA16627.1 Drosophila melanogaster CG11419 gene product-related [Plasmodium yoelii yoelii]ETB61646.1 hypothetical protein YYC_01501 [Plasmodium yoelii 17X]WBY60943.1 anaphase-promoting complex subunit 10 [Plasmodium yoelii yoelii]CDU20703.1 anaphase promoting complex subunit 10, putative [Plasmodium yoelii]VTZ81666.1 anaphase-promoting complex subunit 10, putative [Plasmodium yoelii]|eukprot:XP_725062.1 uncharacterized protein PY17X_1435600 [Plasmodium yoelii]
MEKKDENDYLWKIIKDLNMVDKKEKMIYSNIKINNLKTNKNNLPKIKISKKYVEVGCLGIWKLSSSKNKYDIKKLKDNDANTYWQSSSIGPHTITIQFLKLTKVSKIFLLFNYLLDESYTPCEILIKIGNDEHNLEYLCTTYCDINKYSLEDPFWFVIDLKKINFLSFFSNYNLKVLKNKNVSIYCHCLQICILSSQHYGKDTRVRQIKIYGPNYSFYKYDKMILQKT